MNKEQLDKVIIAAELLREALEDAEPREDWVEEDALEALGPTDEEISLNIKGDPDWHLDRPNQFERMKHLYDPRRETFDASTFHLYGRFGIDTRPYKPEMIYTEEYPQGVMVRDGATEQHGAPYDPYFKPRYVIDDHGKWWHRA
jgi:hypothetical protein